uniref:Uncharacterized protein n=1 Tax=Oryza meridionalis TaxID=40149 RepID=A0A0E0EPD9_9ORYZ
MEAAWLAAEGAPLSGGVECAVQDGSRGRRTRQHTQAAREVSPAVEPFGGAVVGGAHRRLCTGGQGDTVLAVVASAPSILAGVAFGPSSLSWRQGRADLWAVA